MVQLALSKRPWEDDHRESGRFQILVVKGAGPYVSIIPRTSFKYTGVCCFYFWGGGVWERVGTYFLGLATTT